MLRPISDTLCKIETLLATQKCSVAFQQPGGHGKAQSEPNSLLTSYEALGVAGNALLQRPSDDPAHSMGESHNV
jgi:hypothetical protein